MSLSEHSYQIFIQGSPEAVWRALTDPEQTARYWYGAANRSEWRPGSRWTSESAAGELYLDGEIVEIDPPHRLVQTFQVRHEPNAAHEAPSRVTWEIEKTSAGCRLSVLHEQLGPATAAYVTGGWEYIVSGLKSVVESDGHAGPNGNRESSDAFGAGRVVWFELSARDVEEAKTYYAGLFGWSYEPMVEYDSAYWLIKVGERSIGGIQASPPEAAPPADQGVVPYVGVTDLRGSIGEAERLGGTVVAHPTSLPDGSQFAVIRDPLGNRLGLWAAA